MQPLYSIGLLLVFVASLTSCLGEEESNRDQKLISTFQIVRFPNDPCTGSNSRNGTCYTSQECSDKSGTSAGSCADGFGVCCTFIISTCGSTTSENLTAWTQPTTVPSGHCGLTVCPIDDNICSIRLDFTNFVITGPATGTVNSLRRKLGHYHHNTDDAGYVTTGSATRGSCLTDIFYSKSASPSTNPPSLCGTMTGHHMYMEADVDNCNELSFYLADAATAGNTAPTNPLVATQFTIDRGMASLATRTWDVTITQIECTSALLPPVGCTRYYWNTNAGLALLDSANYQTTTTSIHLGQQHDRFCIRRERGMCVGCFSAAATAFSVSGRGIAVHYTAVGGCCGYSTQTSIEGNAAANYVTDGLAKAGVNTDATNGLTQYGWDCIIIPGAYLNVAAAGTPIITQTDTTMSQVLSTGTSTNVATAMNAGTGPQICGQGASIGAGSVNIKTSQYDDIAANILDILEGVAQAQTLCTRQTPFVMEFMSDDLEGLGAEASAIAARTELGRANLGFSIYHKQLAC